MLKYIEEANELFPQKPYELGAKKSREIFAKHSKSLELKRTKDISVINDFFLSCLLYTSPSPRDRTRSRMPSSA